MSKMRIVSPSIKAAEEQLEKAFSNVKISMKDNTRVGNLNIYPDKVTFHDRILNEYFEVKITKLNKRPS